MNYIPHLPRACSVKAHRDMKLLLQFEDGVEGEVSLDIQNAGIFQPLFSRKFFEQVKLGGGGTYIMRNDMLEFDIYTLYFQLIGKNLFTGETI